MSAPGQQTPVRCFVVTIALGNGNQNKVTVILFFDILNLLRGGWLDHGFTVTNYEGRNQDCALKLEVANCVLKTLNQNPGLEP